jgi:hypothetical protein
MNGMTRYWVNLGYWDSDASGEEQDDKIAEEMNKIANAISTGDTPSFVYKTFDKDDAIAVAKEAVKTVQRYYPHLDQLETDVSITTQPECRECEHLARFSETYCPRCGRALTPSEDVEF